MSIQYLIQPVGALEAIINIKSSKQVIFDLYLEELRAAYEGGEVNLEEYGRLTRGKQVSSELFRWFVEDYNRDLDKRKFFYLSDDMMLEKLVSGEVNYLQLQELEELAEVSIMTDF